ncbi:RHS repeat-associated core domain-containing protein [Variovorax defluvii]|uniref:RHS repeat domain-containing protein n=1 Tax=Variovorax defluvii TaxID=913761 RepID=UPI0031EE6407
MIARASSFIGLGDRSKRPTPASTRHRRVRAPKPARGSAARHREAAAPSAPPIPAWQLWRIVTIVLAAFAVAGALQAGPSLTTPQIGTTTAGLTDSLKSFFSRLWSPATSGAEQQGTAYMYDEQGNLLSETGTGGANSSGSTQYIYLPTANGPMPIAAVINGQIYAVHSDHLNTPRRLTNSQGQPVWQWAYSAFGDEKPTTAKNRFANVEVNPNPGTTSFPDITYNVRYPNHYADEESGLFENRDRFYNPSLGRYTQGDAFGLSAGTNRFVYALDDPLSVFDDDGLAPKKPDGAAPAPYSPLTGGTIKPSPVPGWQPLQLGVPGRARLGGAGSAAGAGRGVFGPSCSPTGVDAAEGARELAKAEVFSARAAPELKKIYGWGNGEAGVKAAREALDASAMARIQGSVARAEVEATRNLYREAAAAGRGGAVAPERAAYMEDILKRWK